MGDFSGMFEGLGDIPGFKDVDYGAILHATRRLVRIHREAEGADVKAIEHLKATATPGPSAESEYVDLCHQSVYLDSACGVATVALLSSLVEGFFHHGAPYLRELHDASGRSTRQSNVRWQAAPSDFWNPQLVVSTRGKTRADVARGIAQFARAVDDETQPQFPADLEQLLPPLFHFRNYVFHRGYEWDERARRDFENTVKSKRWSDHFDWARTGRAPWMAYLSESYVDACLMLVDSSHAAFARVWRRWRKEWNDAGSPSRPPDNVVESGG